MAQRVITLVEYTDDLTGASVAESDIRTIQFSISGDVYEIDLETTNAEVFHKALQPYVEHARLVKRAPRKPGEGARIYKTSNARRWLRKNGWEVEDKGRLPVEARQAYLNAHPGMVMS